MNLPEERTVYLEKENLLVNTASNNPKEVEYLTALQRFNKKRDNFYSMVPIEQTREQIAKNAIEDERNSLLGQIPRGAAGGIVSGVQTLERLGVGAIMQAINDTRHNFEQIALEDKRRWAAVNIKRENYQTDEEYKAAQAQFDKEYKSKYAQIETTYQNVARFGREQMQEMKERHENWLKLSGLSKEESDGFLFDLSAGGASLLMAIGTAALTKSPAATAAVFGAIQGRQSYEEALENGVTPEKAEKIGLAAGAAETILEKFGLEMFLQGLKSRGWAGKIVKNALIEATQEGSQGAANEIIMQKWGGKEADIRQTLEEVAYQALIGGIVGGGATSAHVGVEKAMQRVFPQATAAAQGVTQEGEKLPPPTVEQAEELVRANEGRDLTPQERYGLILANGQHKLEALGVPTETAQKMLADVILQAGSQESLNDVQQMLNDENNPATYKDGDIMAATKEYAEAVRATSKSMTPEYRQQVYDIRDSVREQAMEAGYSEDEAEAAAHVHEAFAQLAYQMSGVAPQEWAKRNKIEFRDQRIKEEDTSFNFGNNVEEYDQDRDGLPDDVYFQESAYTPEGKADTNSQEFKQWFGNSKVVDENGEPLVAYHGTNAENIQQFDKNKVSNVYGSRNGFFFAKREQDAGYGHTVMPVYLSMQKPYVVDVAQELSQLDYDIKTERAEAEAAGYPISRWEGKGSEEFEANDSATAYLDDNYEEIFSRANEGNYDGVIVKGVDGSETYVAFEPTQIKSVYNKGTFDANNPNIYYQKAPNGSERDLFATHNMNLMGALQALKLGGLAMPSMAIRKTNDSRLGMFGDVSFVAHEKMIKPSRGTEIYDRDAWTPSIWNNIRYALSKDAKQRIEKILKKTGEEKKVSMYAYNIEEGLADGSRNELAMDLFLKEKGLPESKRYDYYKSPEYHNWYNETFFNDATPYLYTENDDNTDMIMRKLTLGNIMKVLRRKERAAGGYIGDHLFGVSELFKFFPQKFRNLDEVRSKKGNLQNSDEIYKTIEKLDKDFDTLVSELRTEGKEKEYGADKHAVGIAVVNFDNKANQLHFLKSAGLRTDDEAISKINKFAERMKNEVPTDYFEVKPRRIVGFGEFAGVIMPNTEEYNSLAKQLKEQYNLPVFRIETRNTEQYKEALTELQKMYPNVYFQDEQGEQGNALGKTEFTDTGAVITLLEGANKTTLLHELGHVFLRDFERVALENDNAITRHYTQVIEGFLGKKEGNRWNREQQEKFARTFLEYVRTKDVPEAPEMRNVFDRFKDWLQEIYDAIEGTQFFEKNVSQEAKDFFDEVLAPQAVEVPDVAKFRGKIREIRQAVEDIRKRRLPRVENGLMLRDIKALYSQIKRRMPKAPQTDLLRELRRYGANYAQAGRIDAEAYKNARIPNKPEGIGDDPARWLQDHGYMGESYGETYEAQDNLNEQAFDLIERAMDGEKVYRLDDQAAATQREHYKEELEMIKEVSENIEGAQEVLRNINEMERKGYRALDRDDMHFLEEKIKATEKLANTELDKLEDVKKEIVGEIKKRIDADQLEAYLARISAAKNKEALEAAARRTMLAIEKCYVNRALYTQHLLQSPRQTASLQDLAAVWGKQGADEKRADEIMRRRGNLFADWWKDAFVSMSDRVRRVDKELARKIEDLPRKRVMRNSRYRQYFGDYIAFIYKYVAQNPEDFEVLSWAQMNGNEVAEMEIANKYKAQAINGKNLVQLIKEKNEGLQKIWEEGVNAGLSIGWLEGYNPRRMANSDAFIEFLEGTEEWSAIDRVLKIMGVDQGTNEQKAMAINKYFRGFEPKDLAAAKPGNIKRRDIMYVTKAMSKFYKNSFEALVDYADDMAKAISIKEVFGISEKDLDTSVGQLVLNAREKYRLSHREEELLKNIITAFVRPSKAGQVIHAIKSTGYLMTITNPISTVSQLEDIGVCCAQWGHANTAKTLAKKGTDGWIKLEQIGAELYDVDIRNTMEGLMDKGLRKLLAANGFTFMDRLGKETYINADFQARQKMAKDNPAKLQKELESMFSKEEAKEVMTALKEGNLNNENLQSLLYFDLSAIQPMSMVDMPKFYSLGGGLPKLLYQLKSFALRRANYLYTRTQEQFHNAQTPEEYARAATNALYFFSLVVGYGAINNLLKNFLLGRPLDVTEELIDTMLQNVMFTRFMIKRAKQDPVMTLVNGVLPPAIGTANDLWQDTFKVVGGKKEVSQMNIWSRLPVIGKPYYWWFGGGKAITEKDNKEKGLFKIKGWAGK